MDGGWETGPSGGQWRFEGRKGESIKISRDMEHLIRIVSAYGEAYSLHLEEKPEAD
jgi:hypothetical protein